MPPVFHPFSLQHLGAIVVGLFFIAFFLLAGRKNPQSHRLSLHFLCFLTLGAYPLGQIAWFITGEGSLETKLPLHLCDLAAFIAGIALLTRKPIWCELTYYWGLAATIQGLITPAVGYGFPSAVFVMFFIHHFVVVTVALYLPIVLHWRPRSPWWRSPCSALLWVNAYLVLAFAVNSLLGTNFGFIMHKPENPSLLDEFGPWPWYILAMEACAAVFFLLLTLPWIRKSPPNPASESWQR